MEEVIGNEVLKVNRTLSCRKLTDKQKQRVNSKCQCVITVRHKLGEVKQPQKKMGKRLRGWKQLENQLGKCTLSIDNSYQLDNRYRWICSFKTGEKIWVPRVMLKKQEGLGKPILGGNALVHLWKTGNFHCHTASVLKRRSF